MVCDGDYQDVIVFYRVEERIRKDIYHVSPDFSVEDRPSMWAFCHLLDRVIMQSEKRNSIFGSSPK